MNKKNYHKTLELGNVTLPSNVLYAPLAGCTDYPFRKMSAQFRPGIQYCEMVKMDAIVRYDQGTFHMLDYQASMRPLGAQLCGSKPEIAGAAARILEDLGFDVIDLNCGCPVDKVTKDGSGSGMLRTPHLIGEVISNMVAAVKIPITVKIRAGWDEENIVAAEITKIAEKAGAKAICIHGRTRKQAYKGPANWDHIKASKQAATTIKVIGNGDVLDGESALRMVEHTGCDAVLVARGTLGQPWVAEDIRRAFQGEIVPRRTLEECRQALYEHFLYTCEYQAEKRVVVDMRRVGCWYLKKAAGTRSFREQISRATSLDQVKDLILNFPLSEAAEADIAVEETECC